MEVISTSKSSHIHFGTALSLLCQKPIKYGLFLALYRTCRSVKDSTLHLPQVWFTLGLFKLEALLWKENTNWENKKQTAILSKLISLWGPDSTVYSLNIDPWKGIWMRIRVLARARQGGTLQYRVGVSCPMGFSNFSWLLLPWMDGCLERCLFLTSPHQEKSWQNMRQSAYSCNSFPLSW